MKLGKGVPSVWPGYVAAVASLVLSLLLLLGILVFAMTQVQGLVERYKQTLLHHAMEKETQQAIVPLPVLPPSAVRLPASSAVPSHAHLSRQGSLHLRLIFEAEVADLTPAKVVEMGAALRRQEVATDAVWVVWVQVPASADKGAERTASRLILRVHQALIEQGFARKNLRMQLQRTELPPIGYERGDIVVHALTEGSAQQGRAP